MRHPIAATAAKLEAISPLLGFELGEHSGQEWHRLDELLADGTIAGFIDEAGAAHGHADSPRDAAGVSLAIQLSSLAVRPAVGAVLLDRRGLGVSGDNLAMRRTAAGAFDRLALFEPRCAVLPGDPAAQQLDDGVEVVADDDALRAWVADRLVAAFTPVITQIRATVSYGLSGLWGNLVDGVSASALFLAHERGASSAELDDTWHEASLLVDEIAERVPQIKARPRPFPVTADSGSTLFQVRSTCCLLYKVPGRAGDGEVPLYCTTCPLIDDAARTERVITWLDRRAAQAAP